MAKSKRVVVATAEAAAAGGGTLRRCIGSKRYGIEAHEAAVEDFPSQPSQRDGLGRMCRPHWNQYTAGLARDRKAKAAGGAEPAAEAAEQSQAAARVATKRADRVAAGTTADLRKKVRATAKPAKEPEPIRVKPARGRKTVGEQTVDLADAAIAPAAGTVEDVAAG